MLLRNGVNQTIVGNDRYAAFMCVKMNSQNIHTQ
jgi:hypothetical protein